MGYGINRDRGDGGGVRQGLGQGTAIETPANLVEPSHVQSHSERSGSEEIRPESSDQEIEMLSAQADALRLQSQTINTRISELQGGEVSAVTDVADVEMPRKVSKDMIGRRNVAIVAEENCVSCEICASVCPVEAITMHDIAVIDSQKCTGCGACVNECPNSAISLVELEKVEL
jgi:ferredoxin